MTREEQFAQALKREPALAWLPDFLERHTTAQCYVVGGAVRDALLGRSMPERDYDLVVTGLEANVLEQALSAFGDVDYVGRDFGVFKFMPTGFTHEEIPFIDIALPRTEVAHPETMGGYREFDIVSDPSLPIEEDLKRRDFTINAMAFDARTMTCIDPFEGKTDLEKRCIRTVGKSRERFEEDLSRILRGVRFASELGCDIDPETLKTICDMASHINLTRPTDTGAEFVVPREVLGAELAKALYRAPAATMTWLERTGLLRELVPRVQSLIDVDPTYTLPLKQTRETELSVTVCLLMRALTEDETKEALAFTGLTRLPRTSPYRLEESTLLWIQQKLHPPLTREEVEHMPAAQCERWFTGAKGALLLTLMERLGYGAVSTYVRDRLHAIEARWLVEPGETIPPLLSGNDVLMSGIPEGPRVRTILDDARSQQLEGTLMSREAALAWLKKQT